MPSFPGDENGGSNGLLGAIPVVGSLLGGLFGGGAKKETRNRQREAIRETREAKDELVNAEALANFIAALTKFSEDPLTYTPERIAEEEGQFADEAHQAFQSGLKRSDGQAAGTGSFRSSARENRSYQLARGLGTDIAKGNRTVRESARKSRATDIGALGTLLSGYQNLRLQPELAMNSTLNGVPAPDVNNPFQGLLQGIGTLSTAYLSQPGRINFNQQTGQYSQGLGPLAQFFSSLGLS